MAYARPILSLTLYLSLLHSHIYILTLSKHKPGVLVGNEAVPEFTAKTLPPGSAPSDRTFKPNSANTIHPTSETDDNKDPDATTSASDTLGGATSGDVYTGLGKPVQGQSSAELEHNGYPHRKRPETGLVGVAGGVYATDHPVDEGVQPEQRALEKEEGVYAGKRGEKVERAGEDRLEQVRAEGL